MMGNVWEWTLDCWNENYVGAPHDGSPWLNGRCTRRILRGGSWFISLKNMRVSLRGDNALKVRDNDIGFRVVKEF